jgi:hypothetical protein
MGANVIPPNGRGGKRNNVERNNNGQSDKETGIPLFLWE